MARITNTQDCTDVLFDTRTKAILMQIKSLSIFRAQQKTQGFKTLVYYVSSAFYGMESGPKRVSTLILPFKPITNQIMWKREVYIDVDLKDLKFSLCPTCISQRIRLCYSNEHRCSKIFLKQKSNAKWQPVLNFFYTINV